MRNILIIAGDAGLDDIDFKIVKDANKIVNTAKTLQESLSRCKGNNVYVVGDGGGQAV